MGNQIRFSVLVLFAMASVRSLVAADGKDPATQPAAVGDKKPIPLQEAKDAAGYLKLANDSMFSDGFDKTIPYCNKAIELDPKLAGAYGLRGMAYEMTGEKEKAFVDYAKVIELNPTEARCYFHRGSAYVRCGDFDKAIADFTKVIALDPKDAQAFLSRGSAYGNKGEYDKAWGDVKKCQELGAEVPLGFLNSLRSASGLPTSLPEATPAKKPKYDLAERARHIFDKRPPTESYSEFDKAMNTLDGSPFNGKKELEKAIADFTKAIERDPKNSAPYAQRGSLYEANGECEKAIEDYTKFIGLVPNDAMAFDYRGFAYERNGKRDLAIADFSKAIELDPDYAPAYENRARNYYKKRVYAKAWSDVRKYQALGGSIDPDFLKNLRRVSSEPDDR